MRRAPSGKKLTSLPDWLPIDVHHYLAHTASGKSIRSLARGAGCHASTVLRQIRKYEARREDPLVDEALQRIGHRHYPTSSQRLSIQEKQSMTKQVRIVAKNCETGRFTQEAMRVLRRLCETGSRLVVAPDLDNAIVLRSLPGGETTRTAVLDRDIAQTLALREWIHCDQDGRVRQYGITQAGRSWLQEQDESNVSGLGFAEAATPFDNVDPVRPLRGAIAESPLAVLARRKDKTGAPFLSGDLVAAGEQLREDFELSQLGPRVTQDWDRFLTGHDGTSQRGTNLAGTGPMAARARVQSALRDLGPGLGDVVLRCCCYLEGMEAAEKRMGWSARSGKIVLRIALQRLRTHYDDMVGPHGPLIG
ncbi:MAG: DUF6456 domain-containing protein [Pseudoruegeria sp.]